MARRALSAAAINGDGTVAPEVRDTVVPLVSGADCAAATVSAVGNNDASFSAGEVAPETDLVSGTIAGPAV